MSVDPSQLNVILATDCGSTTTKAMWRTVAFQTFAISRRDVAIAEA